MADGTAAGPDVGRVKALVEGRARQGGPVR